MLEGLKLSCPIAIFNVMIIASSGSCTEHHQKHHSVSRGLILASVDCIRGSSVGLAPDRVCVVAKLLIAEGMVQL